MVFTSPLFNGSKRKLIYQDSFVLSTYDQMSEFCVSLNFTSFNFSGRRNNGSMPSHWCAGSGSIARKSLQTLEQLKIVEKDPNGGRRLTSQGRRDLDRIAAQVANVGLPPKK